MLYKAKETTFTYPQKDVSSPKEVETQTFGMNKL
jgi:hypothetical protein